MADTAPTPAASSTSSGRRYVPESEWLPRAGQTLTGEAVTLTQQPGSRPWLVTHHTHRFGAITVSTKLYGGALTIFERKCSNA